MHKFTNNQAIVERYVAIPSPAVYKMKRMIFPFEKKNVEHPFQKSIVDGVYWGKKMLL